MKESPLGQSGNFKNYKLWVFSTSFKFVSYNLSQFYSNWEHTPDIIYKIINLPHLPP